MVNLSCENRMTLRNRSDEAVSVCGRLGTGERVVQPAIFFKDSLFVFQRRCAIEWKTKAVKAFLNFPRFLHHNRGFTPA
jgi:hypothetical protein